ncbi:SdpI family protein [Hyphomonadaceae bacterium ML37]|nr:SdpI family protein [Hyphomonadaceae bacterium ML37]
MTVKGLAAAAALIALTLAFSVWGWLATPPGAEIAVHWNAAGQPDRYGGKAEAFLLIPGIAVLLSLLFAAAPHIDPRGRNLAASGPVLMTVWIGTVGVLAIVQAALTLTALGLITADGEIVPRAVMLSVCALMVLIGNALGKARPNWFVGVRTPWTLSSDRAWDATHRWAGRGFVLSGLIGAACTLLAPLMVAVFVFAGLILATAAGSVALSFLVWRRDPERDVYSEDS